MSSASYQFSFCRNPVGTSHEMVRAFLLRLMICLSECVQREFIVFPLVVPPTWIRPDQFFRREEFRWLARQRQNKNACNSATDFESNTKSTEIIISVLDMSSRCISTTEASLCVSSRGIMCCLSLWLAGLQRDGTQTALWLRRWCYRRWLHRPAIVPTPLPLTARLWSNSPGFQLLVEFFKHWHNERCKSSPRKSAVCSDPWGTWENKEIYKAPKTRRQMWLTSSVDGNIQRSGGNL